MKEQTMLKVESLKITYLPEKKKKKLLPLDFKHDRSCFKKHSLHYNLFPKGSVRKTSPKNLHFWERWS